MKLLVNICSYDGISTHYCGVGTMVRRYIEAFFEYIQNKNIQYQLNLFTTESYDFSLGYDKDLENKHQNLPYTRIYKLSNGSGGKTSFGTLDNWLELSKNTAEKINRIDMSKYDKVITLIHDTPYCELLKLIKKNKNHIIVWIPHSTVKIHGFSSDKEKSDYDLNKRYEYECSAIKYINENDNYYLGAIGNFIANHLIQVYGLNISKKVNIFNGELLNHPTNYNKSQKCKKLMEEIKNNDSIILSFGRAEKYKNLESTMLLGKELGIKPIVVVQQYYKGQPIVREYKKIANQTNTDLFIDAPFSFPHYIINNFNKPIILLVPSNKEIMGLVINEVRKKNKNNVLIVANNIDGLNEQVNDAVDGILVDLKNIQDSAQKIKKYFNQDDMIRLNSEAQKTLKTKYDFIKNFNNFMNKLLN